MLDGATVGNLTQQFPDITALNLAANGIAKVDASGLALLSNLTRLDLSSNFLTRLEGLLGLSRLTELRAAHNRL